MSRTSHTYRTVIDGPCWESLRESPLMIKDDDDDSDDAAVAASSLGSVAVVLGTLESTNEQVIGLLASRPNDKDDETTESLTSGQVLWKESVARLPAGTAAEAAAATYHVGLTHLYPLMAAQAPAVGGSAETYSGVSVPQSAVVILGGNPEAIWAAQALATLGSDVTLVSANKPSVARAVTVLSSDDDEAFVDTVGQFEALLDTVGREGRTSRAVQLLSARHGCTTYRSTRTRAEEIVGSEGLLWGPGKAKDYVKSLSSNKMVATPTPTLPVSGWGALVEQLLQAKVLAPTGSFETVASTDKATTWVRGWSLKAIWEANTWPSSTDGTRYGFPTLDDEEEDEDDDDDDLSFVNQEDQDQENQETEGAGTRSRMQPSSISPYILSVYGTEGLEKDVLEEELDCILFMSAPYCRTCKKLQAPYARLARLNYEDDDSEVVFAKADIVGKFGKALGKSLGVNAVPAFVLFRKGERFGKALNVSRLPHPQLDLALQFLKEREEWDDSKFGDDDDKASRTKI